MALLGVDPSQVPGDITTSDRCLVWNLENRKGRPTKPLYRADDPGRYADSTDPTTWSDWPTALAAHENGKADGVGWVPDADIVGVDLDKCRDVETGETQAWAQSIIDQFNSYTEVTPSQTGYRIYVRARMMGDRRRNGPVEIYQGGGGRYFTVTGAHLDGTPTTIEPRQDELDAVCAEHLPEKPSTPQAQPELRAGATIDLPDAELLDRAKAAKNGAAFTQLWDGDASDHASHSEADLALANHLAFWTDRDAGRMDVLFRKSGLMREKWDDRRGDRTYGEKTIDEATAGCAEGYRPGASSRRLDSSFADEQSGTDTTRVVDLNTLPLTDTGNAEAFAALYGDALKFDHQRGRWLKYQNPIFCPDADAQVTRLAIKCTRRRYHAAASIANPDVKKLAATWAVKSEHRTKLEAMLALARDLHPITDAGQHWDRDPMLLACQNGVIDLRTGNLRDGRQDDRLTMQASVNYNPTAACPRFRRFLVEIFAGYPGLVDYIQRVMGYALTGLTSEQAFWMLYGSGANGKGALIRAIGRVLGDYAYRAVFSTFLHDPRGNTQTNDLAALVGCRFVWASETSPNTRLNEGRVKDLTGGDDQTARFLHQGVLHLYAAAEVVLSRQPQAACDGRQPRHVATRQGDPIRGGVPDRQDAR